MKTHAAVRNAHSRRHTRRPVVFATFALLAVLGPVVALAGEWPQYRGPNHDGAAQGEENFAENWQKAGAGGPKVLWRKPVGPSFGSFAVAGGKAFLFMERGGNEVCVAMNPDTGEDLWAAEVDKTIFERQGGDGPRTTPAVDGDRVYVFGTYFKLACLSAADGKVLWAKDLVKDFGHVNTGDINKWGNAMSPVVDGKLVIVGGGGPGQAMLAFDKMSGEVVWKSGTEDVTHATPAPATIHGVRQVVFFMHSGLVSVRADDGKELWRHPFPFNVSTASTPIVGGKDGEIVYCSAGYGVGAGAVKITKNGDALAATELWRKQGELPNHWTTPVHHDGHLYGIFGFKQYGTAPLKCVELATGNEKWSRPGFGSGGGTILVDGHVLAQHDTGQITLAKAVPDGYGEAGKVQPLSGKCWTMAVVANGRVYARNDKEAVCLEVSAK